MYEAMGLRFRDSVFLQATVVSLVLLMITAPIVYTKYELDGLLTVTNRSGEGLEVALYSGNVTHDDTELLELEILLENNSSVEWDYTYTLQEKPDMTIVWTWIVTVLPTHNNSIGARGLASNYIDLDIENGRTGYTIHADDLVQD